MKALVLTVLVMPFIFICAQAQDEFIPDAKYQSHASRALRYYQDKDYLQSARSYDTLFKQYKGSGLRSDRYNAACAWALASNVEQAFHYLELVARKDKWDNLTHLLGDRDLVSLHQDKRWDKIVKQVKANKEFSERNLDKALVALLDTVFVRDQTMRLRADSVLKKYGAQSDEVRNYWQQIQYQDSIDLLIIKKIIADNGWPGPGLVGVQGAKTVFLVIQHADSATHANYLPLLRDAVKQKKASAQDLAMLEDRLLTEQGKAQIYGSQVRWNDSTNSYELFPIKDEKTVDERRAAIGLPPLEEYARFFGIEYKKPK